MLQVGALELKRDWIGLLVKLTGPTFKGIAPGSEGVVVNSQRGCTVVWQGGRRAASGRRSCLGSSWTSSGAWPRPPPAGVKAPCLPSTTPPARGRPTRSR